MYLNYSDGESEYSIDLTKYYIFSFSSEKGDLDMQTMDNAIHCLNIYVEDCERAEMSHLTPEHLIPFPVQLFIHAVNNKGSTK